MSILVVNAGSSTVKLSLFGADPATAPVTELLDWNERPADRSNAPAVISAAIRRLVSREHAQIEAVGHRVVHGGTRFHDSVRLDEQVKSDLYALSELAPLHNPPALEAMAAAQSALPHAPHVAVFDTAYFAHLPPRAFLFPLPYEWYTRWGIRRFGFHGISHAYCSGRAVLLLGRAPPDLRLVICHLGNGCSATAVRGGQAVTTTMGYTPMDGLMMGTRCGSVDPGILLHVQRANGLTVEALDAALNRQSGLLGISGVSSDYRVVEAAAQAGNAQAGLALEMFADRVRSTIGALAVTLGGVDALVFTAGIGENAVGLRSAVCEGLGCLGLQLDATRNANARPDTDVATNDSPGRIFVVQTREDLLIARETRRIALS